MEFCAFAVSANLKESCLSSETVVFLLFYGGQFMTCSSKSSFCMPSCNDFNHFKKTCFRTENQFTWNLFRSKKVGIQQTCSFLFFIFAGNEMVGKSFNLLWSVTLIWCKRCPRDVFYRLVHIIPTRRLFFSYILQLVKGT